MQTTHNLEETVVLEVPVVLEELAETAVEDKATVNLLKTVQAVQPVELVLEVTLEELVLTMLELVVPEELVDKAELAELAETEVHGVLTVVTETKETQV
jgi:hypothetical protein